MHTEDKNIVIEKYRTGRAILENKQIIHDLQIITYVIQPKYQVKKVKSTYVGWSY